MSSLHKCSKYFNFLNPPINDAPQLPLHSCSASLITRVSMSDDILYEVAPPTPGSNERSCEPSHTN